MRLALALLLAVHVAVTPESFGWPCPDDDDGTCEAGCTDCASCGHSALGDVADVRTEPQRVTASVPEQAQRPAPSPDPGDILHVPIVRSA